MVSFPLFYLLIPFFLTICLLLLLAWRIKIKGKGQKGNQAKNESPKRILGDSAPPRKDLHTKQLIGEEREEMLHAAQDLAKSSPHLAARAIRSWLSEKENPEK